MSGRLGRADDDATWHGFHAFYHSGLDRLLAEWTRPLIISLFDSGEVDGFYFIRYHLGGPHVRLRLRCPRRAVERVAAAANSSAETFFARHPSRNPVPNRVVHRRNRTIIPGDPHADESDDRVFPDNSLLPFPVRFEIERYGGRALLGHSLDMFALSSAAALFESPRFAGRGESARMTSAGRILVAQAWGHAADGDAFLDLLDYGRRFMGRRLRKMVEEGDRAYATDGESLQRLVLNALRSCAEGDGRPPPRWLVAGSQRLSADLATLPGDERWHVLASQLHMTVIRLGMDNPHEVYLLRMLWRAAGDLAAREPAAWRRIWASRNQAEPAQSWRGLLASAVADLAAAPAGATARPVRRP